MALAAFAVAASAQTKIGFTNGTIGRNNITRYGQHEKQGMAIRLSHEKLQALKGQTINAIDAVYGSKNVTGGKIRVFVTEDLNGTPLSETTAAIANATTKWNTTPLDKPYTITGNEKELFIGTDMQIASGYNPLSVDFSADIKNACFAYNGETWEDVYGNGCGAFNVRAVLADASLSMTDAVVKDITLDGYNKAGTEYDFGTELLNFGTTTITDFDLIVSVDGGAPKTTHFSGLNLAPSAVMKLSAPYTTTEAKGGELTIKVTNVNGADEADALDNATSSDVYFYPANMERAILVEEFTGAACVNCPSGKQRLDAALAATKENTVEICHHLGYQPDIYSMDIQEAYLNFYGSNSTFAPAVMLNRAHIPGVTANGTQSPAAVFDIGTSLVNHGLEYCAANSQPYASLSLQTEYDEQSRDLKVKFSLYCHRDLPEGQNALNILIAQDGLVSPQQGASDNYTHNLVCRGSLLAKEGNTGAWGKGIPAENAKAGETYTWETTYNVPDAILSDYMGRNLIPTDVPNMRLVAYIAHYDANNINNNNVFNAIEAHFGKSYTQTAFPAAPAGIEEIGNGALPTANSKFYNLAGQRVSNNSKGLIIINGKKYYNK